MNKYNFISKYGIQNFMIIYGYLMGYKELG